MLATLPLDQIENGQRLRQISEAQVASLINSISDVGLLNPITVYRRKLLRGGEWVEGFGLVAGLHRKTACERLGLAEIEANILDLSDLECQIAECDENLCAPQLSPADRARFTSRRKDAYEALHPGTKLGSNQHTRIGHLVQPNFAADQAERTGVDPRTVRRDAERGEKIDASVLDMIKGSKLDTGVYLDKLKHLSVKEQVEMARRDRAALRNVRAPVKAAPRPVDDASAIELQVASLMTAWNKAGPEAREEFLGRIGIPAPAAKSDREHLAETSDEIPRGSHDASMGRHAGNVEGPQVAGTMTSDKADAVASASEPFPTPSAGGDTVGTDSGLGTPPEVAPIADVDQGTDRRPPKPEAAGSNTAVSASSEPPSVAGSDPLRSAAAPRKDAEAAPPKPRTLSEVASDMGLPPDPDPRCRKPEICREFSHAGLCLDCRVAAGLAVGEAA